MKRSAKAEATSCFESADEAKHERRSDVVWRFSRWISADDVIRFSRWVEIAQQKRRRRRGDSAESYCSSADAIWTVARYQQEAIVHPDESNNTSSRELLRTSCCYEYSRKLCVSSRKIMYQSQATVLCISSRQRIQQNGQPDASNSSFQAGFIYFESAIEEEIGQEVGVAVKLSQKIN
ncbi:armadillo repeat-containing protein 4 [Dorcoceras hygrometricum]|uniref:Armadillo repeat-containing protein 4 n=1 Tax=Dorcoceras hygrometricum TaxID=472368 RepID=A0A2Z7BBJ8_9LAMI|nr:armadillo repeat-containing protein 4 [Dorcoceras hygrometricum]